jgi:hypothetical protein
MKSFYIPLLAYLMFGIMPATLAQENRSDVRNYKIKEESFMIGGNMGYSAQFYKSTINGINDRGRILTLEAAPKVGYFVYHDIGAGLQGNIVHNRTTSRSDTAKTTFTDTYVLAGPFLRYYHNWGLFWELGVSVGLASIGNGIKDDIFQGNLGLGYAYFLNEKVAIEPMIFLRYTDQDGSLTNGNIRMLGPVFNVSVQAYLFKDRFYPIKDKYIR